MPPWNGSSGPLSGRNRAADRLHLQACGRWICPHYRRESPPKAAFLPSHRTQNSMPICRINRRNGSLHGNPSHVLRDTAPAIRAIEIETYNLEHPTEDRTFPAIESIIIGVAIDRDARRAKISGRLQKRLDSGMIDEVKGLLDSGIPAADLIYYGLEYKYITEYIIGKIGFEEMFRRLEIAIHQFAKRQMTWFRGMERRGFTIHWVDALLPMEEKVGMIKELINAR